MIALQRTSLIRAFIAARLLKDLARQNQSAGFDLNAWIPVWKSAGSGRSIPGRN